MILADANQSEHLSSIWQINLETGATTWTIQHFKEELPNTKVAIIQDKKEGSGVQAVVGFIIAHYGEILAIATSKAHQRHRVGTLLLKALIEERPSEPLWLEVRASNLAAIQFYLYHGFKEVTRRKGYYGGIEDAVIMQRSPSTLCL